MADVFAGMPCRDEDVAREGVGDYPILAPKCEILTDGSDGVLGAGAWTFASASNDFAAQGIQPGHVVVLESRAGTDTRGNPKALPMGNAMLGITSATGTVLAVHRPGYGAVGRPPGGAAGLSGITFKVPSVLSHIQTAAVEVRRMLAIDAAADLSALADVKYLAVLLSLRSLYFAEYRQPAGDTWRDKLEKLDAQIERELKSLRGLFPSSDPDGLDATAGPISLGISRGRGCAEFGW